MGRVPIPPPPLPPPPHVDRRWRCSFCGAVHPDYRGLLRCPSCNRPYRPDSIRPADVWSPNPPDPKPNPDIIIYPLGDPDRPDQRLVSTSENWGGFGQMLLLAILLALVVAGCILSSGGG